MLIFMTGATGLIGRRLVLDRLERGDRVLVLSRNAARANQTFATEVNPNIRVIEGDCTAPGRWQRFVDTCDVVIHLAGAGIADKRWSESYKRELWDSRIDSTHQIVNAIEAAVDKPQVLINASAVGFYGDHGESIIDESTPPPREGSGFLTDLSLHWEGQARRAIELGVRTVLLRTGMVLDDRGGALREMMTPFRWYVGGAIGSGKQWVPWIHYRDVVGLVALAVRDQTLRGPLNLVAPNPVRNKAFSRALAEAMGRPCWAPVPGLALRALLGEFAKYLLASQRVVPTKAQEHGYHFLFPNVEDALQSLVEAIERREQQENGGPAAGGLGDESIDVESNATSATDLTASVQSSDAPVQATPRTDRPKLDTPSRPIRLVAVDVDGTLLRSDGRLGQSVIEACRAASRRNCVVVAATARPPRSMQSIMQTLGTEGPTINYNGAVIWNPQERKAQFHEALDGELAQEIVESAKSILPDILVSVEILDRWYTDRADARLRNEQERRFEPDAVGPIASILAEPITKLMLLADTEALSPVMEMIRDHYWSKRRVAVFLTDPHVIQITHPRVDKAVALQRIARRMGIAREEVMAIGDGPNDAGMMEWAGFGVAVENACEIVRSLADVVVPSNDEMGVARALQRFVLNNV